MHMKDEYYPSLLRASDSASQAAQKTYFYLQGFYLYSLILASIVGTASSLFHAGLDSYLYPANAIILSLGLLVLWVTRSRRDDKVWFDCRAIAESVKTATWRFMMNIPPFQNEGSVDELFGTQLREISESRPDCAEFLADRIDRKAAATTSFMKEVRSLSFQKRKEFYIENRLGDQKKWYLNKARNNARIGRRWFWGTLILQSLAVGIAFSQVTFKLNIVPILTTCAAGIAAWSQMKRHDDLAKTYFFAAQELIELESIGQGLLHEDRFPQLVEQVEEAISREHTMWCARRDVLLRSTVRKNRNTS